MMIPGIMAQQRRAPGKIVSVSAVSAMTILASSATIAAAPVGAVGDLCLAFVMHRASISGIDTPGWDLVATATVSVSTGIGTHSLSVYKKLIESADTSSSVTFTQATAQRMALHYVALAANLGVPEVFDSAIRTGTDEPYTVAAASGSALGQRVVAGCTPNGAPTGSVTQPSGWALTSPASVSDNRMWVAENQIGVEAASGFFTASMTTASDNRRHAAVSVVIG